MWKSVIEIHIVITLVIYFSNNLENAKINNNIKIHFSSYLPLLETMYNVYNIFLCYIIFSASNFYSI